VDRTYLCLEHIESLAAMLVTRQKSLKNHHFEHLIKGTLIAELIALESSADRRAEYEQLLKFNENICENIQKYARKLWEQMETLPKIGERVCSKAREIGDGADMETCKRPEQEPATPKKRVTFKDGVNLKEGVKLPKEGVKLPKEGVKLPKEGVNLKEGAAPKGQMTLREGSTPKEGGTRKDGVTPKEGLSGREPPFDVSLWH
jgi:hypothetical protein